jgi:hypothetical protein
LKATFCALCAHDKIKISFGDEHPCDEAGYHHHSLGWATFGMHRDLRENPKDIAPSILAIYKRKNFAVNEGINQGFWFSKINTEVRDIFGIRCIW